MKGNTPLDKLRAQLRDANRKPWAQQRVEEGKRMDAKKLEEIARDIHSEASPKGAAWVQQLLDEVRRLTAERDDMEDEADRQGMEVKRLREIAFQPEDACRNPVDCCLHQDGEG